MQHSLDELKAEFGIKYTPHPTLDLVILNYDQIKSPKTAAIVRECRGLVLQMHTWHIVARCFDRFFNWGEVQDEADKFDFSDFVVDSKEDGSLVMIYMYKRRWMAHTRGSWGNELMQPNGLHQLTWHDCIVKALGVEEVQQLELEPSNVYVCELTSPYNKVVRSYSKPELYLLGIVSRETHEHTREYTPDRVYSIASASTYFSPVDRYQFNNIDQIQAFLRELSESDPTHEGVVIRDVNNMRWKIKNPTYLSLHRMRGDGDNLFLPKNLLPFVMAGETAELLTYFPEVEQAVIEMQSTVEDQFATLKEVMLASNGIEDQKAFALAITKRTRFSGLLFQLRKEHGIYVTEEQLRTKWSESTNSILKVLYGK